MDITYFTSLWQREQSTLVHQHSIHVARKIDSSILLTRTKRTCPQQWKFGPC